jgi:hypothetical protein
MSILWVAVLALAASPDQGGTSAASPSSSSSPAAAQEQPLIAPRTGKELADAARAALRQWAKPSNENAPTAAREFIALYRELQVDAKLSRSQREDLRLKVRGRLLQLAQQIAKYTAKEAKNRPVSVKLPGNEGVLAQWGGGFGPGAGFGGGAGFGAGGGAVGGANQAGGDDGQTLVELIQSVVKPTTWDTVGGPSSIQYWRTQHALIITAPDEVHEDVTFMLEQLRRASN